MSSLVQKFWDEYGLEILGGLAVVVIFILFIFNYLSGKKGTYNRPRSTERDGPEEWQDSSENDSKLERQAKVILEEIFKRPFIKIRPDFLRNEVTGYNLEIDLYNDSLKLGVEVNGDQHYKFIPFFHRNKDAFVKQRYRDEMKKIKCQQEGITLIEIPYKVGEKGIRPYLLKKLREEGFLI